VQDGIFLDEIRKKLKDCETEGRYDRKKQKKDLEHYVN